MKPFEYVRAGSAQDAVGALHGTLHGDARIEEGALIVAGNGYLQSAPLKADLMEKTLEVWVQLDNLSQRAGGAFTVQTNDGVTFDSLVFAEQEERTWLAGSNNFARTQRFEGPVEETASQPVRLAISYAADGTITAYRNGAPYGRSYKAANVVRYRAGESSVLIGLRHSPPGA